MKNIFQYSPIKTLYYLFSFQNRLTFIFGNFFFNVFGNFLINVFTVNRGFSKSFFSFNLCITKYRNCHFEFFNKNKKNIFFSQTFQIFRFSTQLYTDSFWNFFVYLEVKYLKIFKKLTQSSVVSIASSSSSFLSRSFAILQFFKAETFISSGKSLRKFKSWGLIAILNGFKAVKL